MSKPTTRAQREALARLYARNPDGAATYREFRKRANLRNSFMGCLMVPWLNMWMGIEPDGHTHS